MVRNNTARGKKKLRKSKRKKVQAIRQLRKQNKQDEENHRVVEEGRWAKKLARKGTLVNTDSEEESNDKAITFNVADALQKVRNLDATTDVPDNVKKAKKLMDITEEHVRKTCGAFWEVQAAQQQLVDLKDWKGQTLQSMTPQHLRATALSF